MAEAFSEFIIYRLVVVAVFAPQLDKDRYIVALGRQFGKLNNTDFGGNFHEGGTN